ncbi:MAG: hypothetical protein U0169_24055 [Polyangiaceae bacterium]
MALPSRKASRPLRLVTDAAMELRARRQVANDRTPDSSRPDSKDPRDLEAFDQWDVPAAVVCAQCGDADCPGCDRELSQSGVVAVVPWERQGGASFQTLWSTARATTFEPEVFFAVMPDGPVAPSILFAIACEVLAVSAMVAFALPVVAIVVPSWMHHVLFDSVAREYVLRLLVLFVPSVAMLLAGAHAVHGLALGRGAARANGSSTRSRALRFGLYACGWDLVVGPLGAVVLMVREGWAAGFGVLGVSVGLPTRASRGFLKGAGVSDGDGARAAVRTANGAAVLVTVVGAAAILAALVSLALA